MVVLKVVPYWFKCLLKRLDSSLSPHNKINFNTDFQSNFQRFSALDPKQGDQSEKTLIFHLEGVLLKSYTLFPYFFLVAFEAGGLLRSLVLFLLYPFICMFCREIRIKMMVFICFFGMKKNNLRINRSVLPKFFLEDVGYEGYEMMERHKGGRVGVTDFPTVMVEGFLKDYIGVDTILGRSLKEFYGYYVGLMEEKINLDEMMNQISNQNNNKSCLIGFGCIFNGSFNQQFLPLCQEVYFVSRSEKKQWRILPRENYPKPLIFHDGRLAFRPTYLAAATMLMWMPFGFFLCIIRLICSVYLPYKVSIPILASLGMRARLLGDKSLASLTNNRRMEKQTGTLYVCNHKTLLDPIYISFALGKTVSAVTYSISRVSEMLSPLKTVSLTRDRVEDAKMMKEILSTKDLVICPEGTTCREPYLLRFSPLFAEVTDDIVPVALDVQVTMFYGTTASGLKCLDPFFFLWNPYPMYTINFLEKLPKCHTCSGGGKSKFEVANYVQTSIANTLKFECTSYTRKDKYMILAGNEGIV
ncbi:scaffold/adaptor protein [Lithospermum erythrorhizon]|uniref:Scaffold/adaptor protein n=1 Tax=Lithospermum erythrorhizon TaxID=34254 RepID=A0AAV3Q131_LITER